MSRVYIYDTTLRDGAQTEGVSFSCEDKLDILNRLDEFGVDFVEGGWPGSNPRDDEFFERAGRMDLRRTALTAFGSTRRHGIRPDEDQNLSALASCPASWCCIFGKSWDFQVTDALRIGLDDNLEMIEDSVRFLRDSGKRVMFDAEHFFDGYHANRDYALAALRAAERGGAEWLVLCDTNGGTLPREIAAAVEDVLLRPSTASARGAATPTSARYCPTSRSRRASTSGTWTSGTSPPCRSRLGRSSTWPPRPACPTSGTGPSRTRAGCTSPRS